MKIEITDDLLRALTMNLPKPGRLHSKRDAFVRLLQLDHKPSSGEAAELFGWDRVTAWRFIKAFYTDVQPHADDIAGDEAREVFTSIYIEWLKALINDVWTKIGGNVEVLYYLAADQDREAFKSLLMGEGKVSAEAADIREYFNRDITVDLKGLLIELCGELIK